jgi:ribosomal protein S18 acetylase RimI-like enzyme
LEETVTFMDEDPFSDWGLKPVELADKATFTPFLASLEHPLSDYTFSQIYTWRNSLRILWSMVHSHLCIFANGTGDLTLLMPPIGQGNSTPALREAFELMDDYNAAHGVPGRSRVEYVSDELLHRFDLQGLHARSMGADYVYDTRRMIDLVGGDLASKRQAKNRFMRNNAFLTESYDADKHQDACRRLLDQWRSRQDAQHDDEPGITSVKRQKEAVATELTLRSARDLGLRGMIVRAAPAGAAADDLPIRGFTFGEPLGRDQSSIVIEKTDLACKGLAQYIFSEFCAAAWADRPFVNVGDDWGLETLAWTKQSYRPVQMMQKHVVSRQPSIRIAVPAAQPAAPAADIPVLVATPQPPPSPVVIREAVRGDLAGIAQLEQCCRSTLRVSNRQLHYLIQRRSAVVLVAECDGRIVGEGIALFRQHARGITGRIYSVAVQEDHRGRHIGRDLLSAMLDALGARGARRVYLEVDPANRAATALYESAGFGRIGVLPDYYGHDRAALHMLRKIPAAPSLFDPALAGV